MATEQMPDFLIEQQEYERDFLRAIGIDPDALDQVARDTAIDTVLAEIAEAKAAIAQNDAVAQRRIDMIRQWAATESAPHQRRIDRLEAFVGTLMQGYDFGKKKSRELAHGSFGYRKAPPKLEITDKAAALAFSLAHDVPVKQEPQVSALKEYVQSAGVVPDGCEYRDGEDRMFIKTLND